MSNDTKSNTLNKTLIAVLSTVLGGGVLGHFSWLVSVEKRLGVEDRVERLEDRLEPVLIDWLLKQRMQEMENDSSAVDKTPANPLDKLYAEQAARDIKQWRLEQRTITDK